MRLNYISILWHGIKKIKFKIDEYLVIIKIMKKPRHSKSFFSDLSNDKIIPLKKKSLLNAIILSLWWKIMCSDGCIFNLLISVAIMVMLCHGDDSRSRGFKVKIEPFSAWILKIRSISVCRSTEYLKEKRLINPSVVLRLVHLLFLKLRGIQNKVLIKTWPVKWWELFWFFIECNCHFRQSDIFGYFHYYSSMITHTSVIIYTHKPLWQPLLSF